MGPVRGGRCGSNCLGGARPHPGQPVSRARAAGQNLHHGGRKIKFRKLVESASPQTTPKRVPAWRTLITTHTQSVDSGEPAHTRANHPRTPHSRRRPGQPTPFAILTCKSNLDDSFCRQRAKVMPRKHSWSCCEFCRAFRQSSAPFWKSSRAIQSTFSPSNDQSRSELRARCPNAAETWLRPRKDGLPSSLARGNHGRARRLG